MERLPPTGRVRVTRGSWGGPNGWALVSSAIAANPTTSTVNAPKGHSEANGFDVALGATGQVALEWAGTTDSTADLSLDVTGYWK